MHLRSSVVLILMCSIVYCAAAPFTTNVKDGDSLRRIKRQYYYPEYFYPADPVYYPQPPVYYTQNPPQYGPVYIIYDDDCSSEGARSRRDLVFKTRKRRNCPQNRRRTKG